MKYSTIQYCTVHTWVLGTHAVLGSMSLQGTAHPLNSDLESLGVVANV
jgi:hypothetical protein